MIQLKPVTENVFQCPECGTTHPIINNVVIEAIHSMADCTCTHCSFEFYQGLPTGHAALNVLSIGKSDAKFYQLENGPAWLSESFFNAHIHIRSGNVPIQRIIYEKYEKVIILNTLDYLYGHVLLKLYNAFRHLKSNPELGLIVVVPKVFQWLIPKGCAEAWIVDLKLSEYAFGHESIRQFISAQFDRFQTIYLSRASSHPMITDDETQLLTQVVPFDLACYATTKPTVTFVLREDRFWFSTPMDYWFYRVCRKMKMLRWGRKILSGRQNGIVRKVIRNLKRDFAAIDFYIVGLGSRGGLEGAAIDEREKAASESIERRWCRIYAKSHVVIGVHGSNMLLPTALAAGCVEVLPEDRYGNMIQDVTVRYSDRKQLFFYRFAEQYARPKSIARMAEGMIRDYELFEKNMS